MERRMSLSIIYGPSDERTLQSHIPLRRRHTAAVLTLGHLSDKLPDFLNDDLSLVQVLNNEGTLKIFGRFLEEEHSEENLDFWLSVNRYKRQSFLRRAAARRLYAKFVIHGCKYEINIPHHIRMGIVTNLRHHRQNLFDEAQAYVFKLISMDSFQRFQASKYYLDCKLIHSRVQLERFNKN